MNKKRDTTFLRGKVTALMPSLRAVVLFSVVSNVLLLAPSWYMFEVYGRVVNSRSVKTLLMVTVLVIGAYLLLELLEWVKKQIMLEASQNLDRILRPNLIEGMFAAQRFGMGGVSKQALQDMKSISEFMVSPVFFSLIDAPLAVITGIFIFIIHPLLGWFAVLGALVLLVIGLVNASRIHVPLQQAQQGALDSRSYAVGLFRNAPVIASMGMHDHVEKRWLNLQQAFIALQAEASTYAGNNTALSKMVQNLLSSFMLGFGAWLALRGELKGDLMIVASILSGRLLAPLVLLIGGWRQVDAVRDSYLRLERLLDTFKQPDKQMTLPVPTGHLSIEGLFGGPPHSKNQIIKGVSFSLHPGNSLAIVGPSASGKTTLSRFLVGLWQPMSGTVRLDGSDVYVWDKRELGPHIGYLPQRIELIDGTLGENIARFGDVDEELLHQACRIVGLDAFVSDLPDGFSTPIGPDGAYLSGGQRQRVALARAVYGLPRLIVLDEPNSSLDEAGDVALAEALVHLKRSKATVIVITHRNNILSIIDYMMVLVDGKVFRIGKTQEVLAQLQTSAAQQKPDGKMEENVMHRKG